MCDECQRAPKPLGLQTYWHGTELWEIRKYKLPLRYLPLFDYENSTCYGYHKVWLAIRCTQHATRNTQHQDASRRLTHENGHGDY